MLLRARWLRVLGDETRLVVLSGRLTNGVKSMSKARFILIGGFLVRQDYDDCPAGAGVSPAGEKRRHRHQRSGDRSCRYLRVARRGFRCGRSGWILLLLQFPRFDGGVERLEAHQRPDVILAEPVGSCTDIVATVVQPLRRLYQDRLAVAPYGVILKPSHGRKILMNAANAGFSPKAAYIFRKQLEEADFVILNRVDELGPDDVDELHGLIAHEYPGVPIVRMSAKTGLGFDGLLQVLDQQGHFGHRILQLDYDIYAEGEAELGWLNSSLRVTASTPFSLDDLALNIVRRLQELLAATVPSRHISRQLACRQTITAWRIWSAATLPPSCPWRPHSDTRKQ